MSALDEAISYAASLHISLSPKDVEAVRAELAALRAEVSDNYREACCHLGWENGPDYPRGGLARAIHQLAQEAEEARSREETARAEVERLRQAQREYEHEVQAGRSEQHDRLVAEVERLRAQLEKCKKWVNLPEWEAE